MILSIDDFKYLGSNGDSSVSKMFASLVGIFIVAVLVPLHKVAAENQN